MSGNKKKKGRGCLTAFLVVFVIMVIGSAFSDDDDLSKLSISADTTTIYDINTDIPIKVDCEPSGADLTDLTCDTSGGELTNADGKLSFTADKEGSYRVSVSCGDIKSNTLTIKVEDKAAIAEAEAAQKKAEEEERKRAEEEAQKQAEEEARKKAEEEAAQKAAEEAAAAQQTQAQEEMVWISGSGECYHSRSSCSGMKNPYQVTKSEAESLSRRPCSKCY